MQKVCRVCRIEGSRVGVRWYACASPNASHAGSWTWSAEKYPADRRLFNFCRRTQPRKRPWTTSPQSTVATVVNGKVRLQRNCVACVKRGRTVL